MKKLLSALFIFGILVSLHAQIQDGGTPFSFNKNFLSSEVPVASMPEIDFELLRQQDEAFDQIKNIPWRFGKDLHVNFSIENSGIWEELPNGDKLWRLAIHSSGAQTINLVFNRFNLPFGAQLFIYNEDKSDVRGAFTYKNNLPHGGLGTDLIHGDKIYVELYEPAEVKGKTKLQIGHVVHGYRSLNYLNTLKGIGDSGNCNNNVICPVGDNWRDQIRSVGIMISGNSAFCSGALINNTCNDGKPYFLTANHCVTANQVGNYVIRFNFESTTCTGNNGPYPNQSISGTTLRASRAGSDFCLLELSSAPPVSYNVYYSGWDRTGTAPTSSVGIHHPSGDLKKISFDNNPATSSTYSSASTWRVGNWESGTTEGGSSGSPLFNQNKLIVGQLYGGSASCSSITEDHYGKFDVSWNAGTGASARLSDWLDACNTNVTVLAGIDLNVPVLDDDVEISFVNPFTSGECSQELAQVIRLRNNGANAVTNVTFSYGLGSNTSSYTWTGNLAFGQFADIPFADMLLCDGNYTYNAFITSSNLTNDQNLDNNNYTFNFDVTSGRTVLVELQTNFQAAQNSFEILDADNNVVASESGFSNVSFLSFEYCLPPGDYTFKMYDTGNNGMGATIFFDEGYYRLTVDGVQIRQITSFGGLDVVDFTIEGGNINPEFSISGNFQPNSDINFNNLTNNTDVVSYEWIAPGANTASGADFNFTTSYSQTGTYQVSLYARTDDGCEKFTKTINIIGVNIEKQNVFGLSVFPNPTSDFVSIKHDTFESLNLKIYNSIGTLVYSRQNIGQNHTVDMKPYTKGIYLLSIESEKETVVKKLIVK